jgi:hypothetical protein
MAICQSTRHFHNQIEDIRAALESLFHLALPDHENVVTAAGPIMAQFKQVVQSADVLCGPDDYDLPD